ncbi:ABC transporter ATP-binding protein [Mangrovimicrobium sediminis]|uniref:ABC transporter ATP-binding protein n=1 Tax=Mangrovimicrobium sediminis TaxID=2562682 RepID=A0A4Z0LXU3_9GAMM|nr:ABC transporter ATP-binding protein [Haliea sp. SAOS-164]TGD72044.1 ABC transporter ATP-binding protein [Haliea sp. SAOS-164]
MIELRGVAHRYPGQADEEHTFTGVDLEIPRHSFVAVVGRSGCGKSTLLNVIAGLDAPCAGSVSIDGKAVCGPPDAVSLMFQAPTLLPWLPVLDNVLFPLRIAGADLAAGRDRALQLLELCGIADRARARPQQLSGGMQQRVALCRALVSQPSVLLMDEPFGALDALTRELMGEELLRLRERQPQTVLMVTHSIEEAVLLADRVVVMAPDPGRIREIIDVDLPRPRDLAQAQPRAVAGALRELIFERGGSTAHAAGQPRVEVAYD